MRVIKIEVTKELDNWVLLDDYDDKTKDNEDDNNSSNRNIIFTISCFDYNKVMTISIMILVIIITMMTEKYLIW